MHTPTLKLDQYLYRWLEERACYKCKDYTPQEVYLGHNFNKGSTVLRCMICLNKQVVYARPAI